TRACYSRLTRLPARMELPVHLLEAVAIDVRVVLGSLDRGVAEEFLHGTEVGAAGQEMRGEAVPQRVWAHGRGQLGAAAVLLHQRPQEDARQRPAGLTDEQVASG